MSLHFQYTLSVEGGLNFVSVLSVAGYVSALSVEGDKTITLHFQ